MNTYIAVIAVTLITSKTPVIIMGSEYQSLGKCQKVASLMLMEAVDIATSGTVISIDSYCEEKSTK